MKTEGNVGEAGGKARVTAKVQGNKVKIPVRELNKLGGNFEIVLPPCQVKLVRCDPQVRRQELLRRRRQQQRWHCDQCPKHYADKWHLSMHQKIHTDPNCFRCPTCRKRCLTYRGFLNHRKKHTGLRPFRCTKCGATFMTNSDLKMHLFHHSGERPFGCGVCGKRYTRRPGLERHTKGVPGCRLGFEAYRLQVLPRDKIPCILCGRSFFLQADLTNHMRYHRGEGDKTGRRKLD